MSTDRLDHFHPDLCRFRDVHLIPIWFRSLLAAGLFFLIGAVATLFAQSGVLDPGFKPTISAASGTTPTVRAIASASASKMVVAGSFTNVNNKPWNCLAVIAFDGTLDSSFSNHTANIGPDSDLQAVAVNTNGDYIISGLFNTPPPQRFLARLSFTGQWDSGFAFGSSGPNGSVDVILVAPDNTVLVGGAFTLPRNKVARILDSGLADLSFNPGTLFTDSVRALARQPNGKILAGSLNLVVRLNGDGTRDTNFDSGMGPNGDVYAIALQADGKVLVGGAFTEFNGESFPYLVRLTSAGAVDHTFDTVGGANDWVKNIVVQPDGRIVITGAFTQFGGVNRSRIARLTSSGGIDPTFCPDAGPDDWVLSMVRLVPSGFLVLGGPFTTANGSPRQSLARIGSTDLRITTLQMQTNGVTKLSLVGQMGLGFILEGGTDLQNWGLISTGVSTVSSITLQDTQSVNYPVRFYRTHSR